jgi:hypothetical protein
MKAIAHTAPTSGDTLLHTNTNRRAAYEMILAGWLIAKGSGRLRSLPPPPDRQWPNC